MSFSIVVCEKIIANYNVFSAFPVFFVLKFAMEHLIFFIIKIFLTREQKG